MIIHKNLNQGHGIKVAEYWNRNSDVNDSMKFRWASRKKQAAEYEVYDDVTWKFEDLVRKLVVRFKYDRPGIPKSTEVTKEIQRRAIKIQHHHTWGKCYTFSINDQWKQWGVSSILIWV